MPNFKSNTAGIDLAENVYLRETDLLERSTAGQLWSWGHNLNGKTGDGTRVDKSSPVLTLGAPNIWAVGVPGGNFGGAIKTDGTLWMWGSNYSGQLGTNNIIHRSSPVQTVAGGTNWKQLSCGTGNHVTAIKTDGTLWAWGLNDFGRLGDNTNTMRSSPVQTISGGTNWFQTSTGTFFTHAIKTDGTLWAWGSNNAGRLGDNTILHRSSPVQTAAGGTNWKQVSGSNRTAGAIKTDGTLWIWGDNRSGQLGDNTIVHRSSPIQTVAGGSNWKKISVGDWHVTALKTDGTLWAWGSNGYASISPGYGQLGDGSTVHRSSPVQTISGGTNWKDVSAGGFHTISLKTDGTVWTWGFNLYGQLGTNSIVHRSSPVQILTVNDNWKQVAAGYTTSSAVPFNEA